MRHEVSPVRIKIQIYSLHRLLYRQYFDTVSCFTIQTKYAYVCMYVCSHTLCSKSMDQPGKVANPARGQLNKEN